MFYVGLLIWSGWTKAKAEGEVLGPLKLVQAPPPPVIYYLPFKCGTSAVFLLCYMLCLYVYGLQQYGQLNTVAHYASCFVLFCNLK